MNKFIKEVLDLNITTDFDFSNPNQQIYEFLLKKTWNKIDPKNGIGDDHFIKFALSYLPKDSFIIFFFNTGADKFVQFANPGGLLFLDIPYKYHGIYFGKKNVLIKLLNSERIKRCYRRKDSVFKFTPNYNVVSSYHKGKGDIRVNFYNDFLQASRITYLILNEILGEEALILSDYYSDKLIPVNRKTISQA